MNPDIAEIGLFFENSDRPLETWPAKELIPGHPMEPATLEHLVGKRCYYEGVFLSQGPKEKTVLRALDRNGRVIDVNP